MARILSQQETYQASAEASTQSAINIGRGRAMLLAAQQKKLVYV